MVIKRKKEIERETFSLPKRIKVQGERGQKV
jgi:hypothetical protein